MIVSSILIAQSFRFASLRHPVYMPDVVRGLLRKYRFVRVPLTADELSPPEGTPVSFAGGRLVEGERTTVIRSLQLYPQGVAVETGTSTDDADLVINDLSNEWGIEVNARPLARMYVSQIEYQSAMSFDQLCPPAARFGERLSGLLSEYGNVPPVPEYTFTGFQLSFDPARPVPACEFKVERRANVPHDAHVYFSQAPLKTSDHVTVLQELERSLDPNPSVFASEPPPPSGQSPTAS